MNKMSIAFLCLLLNLSTLSAFTLPAALQSKTVSSLDGTRGIADSVKIWTLGNKKKIEHIWIVFHGDSPNFYVDELKSDRNKLHAKLLRKNEGAVIIQPRSLSAKALGVPAGQGWGDIYGKSKAAQQMTKKRAQYGAMIIKIFRQFEKILGDRSLKLQVLTFSGAGRIDRAFHEYLFKNYQVDGRLRVRDFVKNNLYAVTASDSMVHWSFIDAAKNPLVKSWQRFFKMFPHVKATLVYDKNKTYSRMAKMNQEIWEGHSGAKGLPPVVKKYRQLRIMSGTSHFNTFRGHFDKIFFW